MEEQNKTTESGQAAADTMHIMRQAERSIR